ALDVGLVLFLFVGVERRQVVVAVGQADAALAGRNGVAGRRLGIDGDAGAEEGRAQAADRPAHVGRHLLMAVGGADGGQVGLQRLCVEGLDAGLVGVGAVGVGDLGLIRAGRQVGAGGQAQDQFLHAVVGQLAQQGE